MKPLDELFYPNQSPYFAMYSAGLYGYSIEEVQEFCNSIGTVLRTKDYQNWENGAFKYQMAHMDNHSNVLNPKMPKVSVPQQRTRSIREIKFENFSVFPVTWVGTEQRFFPCSEQNRPLCKWGWTPTFSPNLYDRASAKALSPCGWVGQNMIYQRFIVLDIDGVGHGVKDNYVIEFGNIFRNTTMTLEDPAKPGSFHLYFETDRIIPIMHFPFAKLDLMGNQKNAAVYFKNKQSNGLPMRKMDELIWKQITEYVTYRKDKAHVS